MKNLRVPKPLLVLAFLIPFNLFSQTQQVCEENLKKSTLSYRDGNYNKALALFNKSLKCKDILTASDFYNGACFAALSDNNKLAIKYLKSSIKLGFNKLNHLKSDADLNTIRSHKEYKKLEIKLLGLPPNIIKLLTNLDSRNFKNYIPYSLNNKWGWLDKNTLESITNSTFDYTDFNTAKGLPFKFNNRNYILSVDRRITLIDNSDYYNNDLIGIVESEPTKKPNNILQGFIVKNDEIIEHSDRFQSIELINTNEGHIGIAKGYDRDYSLIDENGKLIKGFKYNFKDIKHFYFNNHKIWFIAKLKTEPFYKIYNLQGEIILNEKIQSFELYSNYDMSQRDQIEYLGFKAYGFIKLEINKKFRIFNLKNKKFIGTTGYDDIIRVNGPTQDNTRSGLWPAQGISEVYFLVKKEHNLIYINSLGKEFILH